MKYFLFSLLALNTSLLLAQTNRVVTNVNDSGPGSLRQSCYSANHGDTISFSPGLLSNGSDTIHLQASINLTKGLVIQGIDHPTDTLFISGENQYQIFYFDLSSATNKDVFISHLGLVNGKALDEGGALAIYGSDSVCISNMLFKANRIAASSVNQYRLGGAIHIQYSNVLIENTRFIRNRSQGIKSHGGAVHLTLCYSTITQCSFYHNESDVYGGALVINYGDAFIQNNTFRKNVSGHGGALLMTMANCDVDACAFIENESLGGAGAISYDAYIRPLYLKITNCDFLSNHAQSANTQYGGGAAYLQGKIISILNTSFRNNTSVGHGGAAFLRSDSILQIQNSSIIGNTSNGEGGAMLLYMYSDTTTTFEISNSTIAFNQAPTDASIGLDHYQGSLCLNLSNSILSGSYHDDLDTMTTSLGYNLYTFNAPVFAANTDISQIDSATLALEAWADNGGFAPTMIPGLSSPALNAGNPSDFSSAQNGPIFGRRDIGAAERPIVSYDTTLACSPVSWWGNNYASAGTYSDTAYNANSIDSVGYLVLERQDTSVSLQNGYLIAAERDINTTYQWVDCNNGYAAISGENDSTFFPSSNGSYAVVLSNGTCSDTSACINYQEFNVSESIPKNEWVTFYPNPSSGLIHISTTELHPEHVMVMDLRGKQVLSIELLGESKIDLSTLPNGTYILLWSHNNGSTQVNRCVIGR